MDAKETAMSYLEPYTAQDYSAWVEDKIMTEGETRLIENTLGLVGEAESVHEMIRNAMYDLDDVSIKSMEVEEL